MQILFTSAECFPAAKVGGLADVVGALPKYLNKSGAEVTVIMPKYDLDWINKATTKKLHSSHIEILDSVHLYTIEQVDRSVLGFTLLLVNIPDLFYRKGVYADHQSQYFIDEAERYTSFAKVILDYLLTLKSTPDIIHCHDHHTALIPFMMTQCYKYADLKSIPTVLTIHNEKYRGRFSWQKDYLIPPYPLAQRGLLDWDGMIDPLACGVKCCWKLSTVSPSYMDELLHADSDLKPLFLQEKSKAKGLLNGIDSDYWNPALDPLIANNLKGNVNDYKAENKKTLCKSIKLKTDRPLIAFIGRLAHEKGADLLPFVINHLVKTGAEVNFLILGTGMSELEKELARLGKLHKNISVHLMYDEKFAHQIYAGADFLIMPSRVEPCGLNQMYAMRYGTIPIVNSTGGLKDTVIDIKYKNGNGIRYSNNHFSDIVKAIQRAIRLYSDHDKMKKTISSALISDFSWEESSKNYLAMYNELLTLKN